MDFEALLEKLEALMKIKSEIKTAIESKGVIMPPNAMFNEYAQMIDEIIVEDLEGKQLLLDVLLSKKPELEGIVTLDSPLKTFAQYILVIGAIKLAFTELMTEDPVLAERLNHELIFMDLSEICDIKLPVNLKPGITETVNTQSIKSPRRTNIVSDFNLDVNITDSFKDNNQ